MASQRQVTRSEMLLTFGRSSLLAMPGRGMKVCQVQYRRTCRNQERKRSKRRASVIDRTMSADAMCMHRPASNRPRLPKTLPPSFRVGSRYMWVLYLRNRDLDRTIGIHTALADEQAFLNPVTALPAVF
jgi:hypothetical protein